MEKMGQEVTVKFAGHDEAGRAIYHDADGRIFLCLDAYLRED